MNILLRKELRLLLPAWVATVVMTTVPVWCMHGVWFARNAWAVQIGSIAIFALGALFLALSPFGQELSFGTFSFMLAQPQTRRRLWWVKMSALTALLLLALEALWLSWLLRTQGITKWNDMPVTTVAGLGALLGVVMVSSGLWTTLLFRQVTAAFWFSLFVPAVIFDLVHSLTGDGNQTLLVEAEVMGVYALAGFLLAGRLFHRAQDAPWGAGAVSLPVPRGLSRSFLAFAFQQRRGSWTALLYKELQLQQVTLIMAAGLGLVYLGAVWILLRSAAPGAFNLGFVDSFWMLCLLVPLVVGSVAVAEERRLNTLEGQLCLAVRKRTSFAVKLLVVLFLGTLFGAGMPWLLGSVGHWAGLKIVPTEPSPYEVYNGYGRGGFARGTFEAFAFLSVLIAAISFYASTLSRSTLQAVGTALMLMVLAFFGFSMMPQVHSMFPASMERAGFGGLFPGARPDPNSHPETISQGVAFCYEECRNFLGRELHIQALAWPAALAAFLWLTYGNYRQAQANQRMWLSNLFKLLIVAVLTLAVSNLVYARPWECFMRLEPAHGPPRISAASGRLKLAVSSLREDSSRGCFVLLPDGRFWAARVGLSSDRPAVPGPGKFVDSSNWVDLAANAGVGALGIQSDHTLWAIDTSARATRIGTASDWQAVADGGGHFGRALKQDGTIWQWRPDSGDAPMFPLGYGSNWCRIFATDNAFYGVARDGGLWSLEVVRQWVRADAGALSDVLVWSPTQGEQTVQAGAVRIMISHGGSFMQDMELVSGFGSSWIWRFMQAPCDFAGTNWSSVASHPPLMAAVDGDGGLWASGLLPEQLFGHDCSAGMHEQPVRIGGNSEWREVSGNSFSIAAVEKSGTLWTQDQFGAPKWERPNEYSDWMAVAVAGDWITALAADGTLSIWEPRYRSAFGLPEPKARPKLSLNIFNTQ